MIFSPSIFCIVNANSNIFTNITIKSILQFYPATKIFIIDAFAKNSQHFAFIDDEDFKNVEIIDGISPISSHILIDLYKTNLSKDEHLIVQQKLSCNNELCVFNTGDLNHTMNIQYAIDMIDQNFILLDCDAPLIQPIDFISSNDTITIAQISMHKIEDKRIFLSKEYSRFVPFIQYFNIDIMKKINIKYYSEELLAENLKLAVLTSSNYKILFPTGTLLLKQVLDKKIPYATLDYRKYVDHFGGSTWNVKKTEQSKQQFYAKYQNMFKRKITNND